jgi:hypothetical protein
VGAIFSIHGLKAFRNALNRWHVVAAGLRQAGHTRLAAFGAVALHGSQVRFALKSRRYRRLLAFSCRKAGLSVDDPGHEIPHKPSEKPQPSSHRDADDDGIEQGEGTGEPEEIFGSSADDIRCTLTWCWVYPRSQVFGGRSRLNLTGQPYRVLAIPIASRR